MGRRIYRYTGGDILNKIQYAHTGFAKVLPENAVSGDTSNINNNIYQ